MTITEYVPGKYAITDDNGDTMLIVRPGRWWYSRLVRRSDGIHAEWREDLLDALAFAATLVSDHISSGWPSRTVSGDYS